MQSSYLYCPFDGGPLDIGTEQRGACAKCGFIDYANPKPCVAALVVASGKVLLGRRRFEPQKGMWDILGGFIEAGESAEDAVRREVLEETGLLVNELRFLGSLPDVYGARGEPTLNLCFVAEPHGGEASPQSDVAELRWFSPDELPQNLAFAHQERMLERWRESVKEVKRT